MRFVTQCVTIVYVISIKKLICDEWNISHIARHNIIPDEVEEVCHGLPLVLRGQTKSRLVLIGPTDAKRILGIILKAKGRGSYYPVTAYDADLKDVVLYNRLRGGENDDE